MGNVNGREDGTGSGTPSEVDDEGSVSGSGCIVQEEGMVAPDGSIQSPLMFTPQVPVVPLQRPDEMQIPNHPWEQTADYEDMCSEQGIPTMITWSYGGKEVAVVGSWDDWKSRMPLQRSGKDFTIMKVLQSGVYQYRFIVDGQWRYAPDFPLAQDDTGNTYNLLDLQDYVPEDLESISGFEPPQSPESSYNNLQLGSEDYAKEPPLVPPHLQMTLLNLPSSHMEIPPPLSRPQHVVLNHLYMQKGKNVPSVVALGSTHRFVAKYVTVVLYKSLQRIVRDLSGQDDEEAAEETQALLVLGLHDGNGANGGNCPPDTARDPSSRRFRWWPLELSGKEVNETESSVSVSELNVFI